MLEGEGEDVDRAEQVGREPLDRKVATLGKLLGRPTLKVLEVGLRVLEGGLRWRKASGREQKVKAGRRSG